MYKGKHCVATDRNQWMDIRESVDDLQFYAKLSVSQRHAFCKKHKNLDLGYNPSSLFCN